MGVGRVGGVGGAIPLDVAEPGSATAGLERALAARERELSCHYAVCRAIEDGGGSVESVLEAVAAVLPTAWEHHRDARACIRLGGGVYRTPGFRATEWIQRAPILVGGCTAGSVELAYLKRHPTRDEGPFSTGERLFLDTLALRLGHVVERIETRARLEAQEADIREKLLHLTRTTTVGEMASGIAHEVSQPLTAISTYAQAARRLVDQHPPDTVRISEVLGKITGEALRAGETVQRLRELVRRREGERRPWSVNALIMQAAPLAKVDARLRGVPLRLSLSPHTSMVWADGVQIQQVILNLIRNGVDAMQRAGAAGGEVLVESGPGEGDSVMVSVTDSGCGLPPSADTDVFRPFFTTNPDGLGLGLSVSRSILALHGGRIWFEHNHPRGTIFRFTLPSVGVVSHA